MVKCLIVDCDCEGRKLGTLAGIELYYCRTHESYGNRIIDFLIMSCSNDLAKKFLKESREEIYHGSLLCEECQVNVCDFLGSKIVEMEIENERENNGEIELL